MEEPEIQFEEGGSEEDEVPEEEIQRKGGEELKAEDMTYSDEQTKRLQKEVEAAQHLAKEAQWPTRYSGKPGSQPGTYVREPEQKGGSEVVLPPPQSAGKSYENRQPRHRIQTNILKHNVHQFLTKIRDSRPFQVGKYTVFDEDFDGQFKFKQFRRPGAKN